MLEDGFGVVEGAGEACFVEFFDGVVGEFWVLVFPDLDSVFDLEWVFVDEGDGLDVEVHSFAEEVFFEFFFGVSEGVGGVGCV